MCVAIWKPAAQSIPKSVLRQCFERNPDGAGFMYDSDGKVVVVKGLFNFPDFYRSYRQHCLGPASGHNVAIHFRIGTSGENDAHNCHPHIVAEDFAFIHNGILSDYTKAQSKESDTIHFMNDVVKPLYERFGGMKCLDVEPITTLLCKFINPSKMIFLKGDGNAWIMNEHLGKKINGCWYSNDFWHPYVSNYVNGPQPNGPWREQKTKRWGETGGAYPGGCYIKGKWHSWIEYDKAYPNWDGPMEWYWRGTAPPEHRKRPLLPATTETATTCDPCETETGAFFRQDAPDNPKWIESCINCYRVLNQQEVIGGEGWCIDCTIHPHRRA